MILGLAAFVYILRRPNLLSGEADATSHSSRLPNRVVDLAVNLALANNTVVCLGFSVVILGLMALDGYGILDLEPAYLPLLVGIPLNFLFLILQLARLSPMKTRMKALALRYALAIDVMTFLLLFAYGCYFLLFLVSRGSGLPASAIVYLSVSVTLSILSALILPSKEKLTEIG